MDYKVIITKKEYDEYENIKVDRTGLRIRYRKILNDKTYHHFMYDENGDFNVYFYSKSDAIKHISEKLNEVLGKLEDIKSKWYYKLFAKY